MNEQLPSLTLIRGHQWEGRLVRYGYPTRCFPLDSLPLSSIGEPLPLRALHLMVALRLELPIEGPIHLCTDRGVFDDMDELPPTGASFAACYPQARDDPILPVPAVHFRLTQAPCYCPSPRSPGLGDTVGSLADEARRAYLHLMPGAAPIHDGFMCLPFARVWCAVGEIPGTMRALRAAQVYPQPWNLTICLPSPHPPLPDEGPDTPPSIRYIAREVTIAPLHTLQEPARPRSCAIHTPPFRYTTLTAVWNDVASPVPKAVLTKLFFLLELEDTWDRLIALWWRKDWSRVVAWTRADDLNDTHWLLPSRERTNRWTLQCGLSVRNRGENCVIEAHSCATNGSAAYAPSLWQSQQQ